MKEKIRKGYLKQMRKLQEFKLCGRKLIKGINTWVLSLCKILRTILKIDEERTQTNGSKDKKIDDDSTRQMT